MDRTHLVRGLDRLLLNQVRGVNATQEAAEEAEDVQARPEEETKQSVPAHFKSTLGRAVANCLLKPPASSVAELFQPRRMAFVYFGHDAAADSDEEEGESLQWGDVVGITSIPETLHRSKADCPVPPDAMNAAADAAVLTEVVGVMKAVKIESKHRGKDKKRSNTDADTATATVRFHLHSTVNDHHVAIPRLGAFTSPRPQSCQHSCARFTCHLRCLVCMDLPERLARIYSPARIQVSAPWSLTRLAVLAAARCITLSALTTSSRLLSAHMSCLVLLLLV